MDTTPDYKYICSGDWNLIFDASMDSFGENAVLKSEAIFQIKIIMSNFELVDIWRVRNPTLRQFTWRRKTPLQMSRLDFFLTSNDLQFGVKSCENLCPLSSDNSPLNSNYRQIRLIIEEEGIGSSTALFLKIINMFLI